MRRVAGSVLALLLVGAPAFAHKGRTTRNLYLEPTADHVVVLVHLKIGGAAQRRAITVLADQDRDRRVSASERTELERLLAVRALDGLRLGVGTATVSLANVQAKLQTPPDGPVEVMVHARIDRPDGALRLTTARLGDPLTVHLVAGVGKAEARRRGRRLRGPMPMADGDRIDVRWSR